MGNKVKTLEAKVIALLKAMDNSVANLWLPDNSESVGCHVAHPQAVVYEPDGDDLVHEATHETQGFMEELELLNRELRGDYVEVFINGDWDCSFEKSESLIVWDKGEVVNLRENEITEYLDTNGYDCYLIPEQFAHEEWDGEFIYLLTPFDKEVRALEFETHEQYFDYLIATKLNGQNAQVRSLFATLKKYGKDKEFILYMKDAVSCAEVVEFLEIVL